MDCILIVLLCVSCKYFGPLVSLLKKDKQYCLSISKTMEDPNTQDTHSLGVCMKHEALPSASPRLVEETVKHEKKSIHANREYQELPPSPPHTDDCVSDPGYLSDVEYPLPPESSPPIEVLQIDKKTPDAHVPRDPRLIRLTGVHPFNVEAPLSALFDEGFLTSSELFYVRNHGAVPEVKDYEIPDWELSITGYFTHNFDFFFLLSTLL